MAVICLHFSEFFKDKILSGEKKGSILKGKWDIPLGEELFMYIAPKNVETSKKDQKIGTAQLTVCKGMKVSELSDKEASICGDKNKEELVQAVKYWHKCNDSDIITFIQFEFKEI